MSLTEAEKGVLEAVMDYLWRNPPANGWGMLDKGEDADRKALLKMLDDMLRDAGTGDDGEPGGGK